MKRRTLLLQALAAGTPRAVSGVYPHLAMFNSQNECGTGGVVLWAGKLWAITYSPHEPGGSDDKLYEIDEQLRQTIRPESIGGTPANRMLHRESGQLFLGPYAIDTQGRVRAIPYAQMFGRPTGNARHLTDPAGKLYFASMEEGFYEVDVKTLAVRQLYEDANAMQRRKAEKDHAGPLLPGYHGKGFYSGQGRVVYANNGEVGGGNLPPDIPSGCLAEWNGKDWKVVRRNQFTEVTGPGGLEGNANTAQDPIWSIGWDHRSLILMLLDGGQWHSYRLPKASHCYDGAHGWNTEWPRIRDIGERDLLMTMHGMFWRFPRSFRRASSAGIAPRSTYLRVVGDFTRWRDRLVLGCDDSAKSEFMNTRRAKGKIAGPGVSQSNLWFLDPAQLDRFGPALGRGAVWLRDDLAAGQASEPFLFSGFAHRMVHLAHESGQAVTFRLEADRRGDGQWSPLGTVEVPARGAVQHHFKAGDQAAWLRLTPVQACRAATAYFHYAARDTRALAPAGRAGTAGALLWANTKRTLYAATDDALYELDAALALKRIPDAAILAWMRQNLAPPTGVVESDAASLVYRDEQGKAWRLPGTNAPAAGVRISREVSTERDLFHAGGTFFELPSNNAGGFALVRPVATHHLPVRDYCSWRGLTVLSGLPEGIKLPAGEFVRSDDGKLTLWLGASDDLWAFGKPSGSGGPWRNTKVQAGVASDPYLMAGYDAKHVELSHTSTKPVDFRLDVDVSGMGLWLPYQTLSVPAGRPLAHTFAPGFGAYWVRVTSAADTVATAILTYR